MLRLSVRVHEYCADLEFDSVGHVVARDPLWSFDLRRQDANQVFTLVPKFLISGRSPFAILDGCKGGAQSLAHGRNVTDEKHNDATCDLVFYFPKRISVTRIVGRVKGFFKKGLERFCSACDAVNVPDALEGITYLLFE